MRICVVMALNHRQAEVAGETRGLQKQLRGFRFVLRICKSRDGDDPP